MNFSALIGFVFLFGTQIALGQFGTITFNNPEYSYQFSDTNYNTTAWVDGGVVIDTNRGILRFEIPFSPIEESVEVPLANYLKNNSTAFMYSGLMDGSYNFEKSGVYNIVGRGVMQVNDSKIGRALPVETILKVVKKSVLVKIVVPLETADYGFEVDKMREKVLYNKFTIIITGETSLR
jgi:hypothetical protein